MKWFKFNSLIALLAVVAVLFTACDSTTDPDDEQPAITNITPNPAMKGQQITIAGAYFGIAQNSGYVLIDNYRIDNVDNWANTAIKVTVPDVGDISNGNVTVYVVTEDDAGQLHTSNGFTLTIGTSLQAAQNLRATSLENDDIKIKWDASPSESDANFAGYNIYVKDTGGMDILNGSVQAGTYEYVINEHDGGTLIPGEIYTMTVKPKTTSGSEGDAATVLWAPAMRFENIKVYSSSSTTFGSGLQLYDETEMKPVVHLKSNSPLWNLGLYTTDGTVTFGSASELGYAPYPSGAPASAEMGSTYFTETDNLDWVFMSDALNGVDSEGDQITYSEMAVDLLDTDYFEDQTKGAVLLFRVKDGTNYNYAKVHIKNTGSGWLQGTVPNTYIEVDISYQVVPNVPYAK